MVQMILLQNRNRLTDLENGLMVTRVEGLGGLLRLKKQPVSGTILILFMGKGEKENMTEQNYYST